MFNVKSYQFHSLSVLSFRLDKTDSCIKDFFCVARRSLLWFFITLLIYYFLFQLFTFLIFSLCLVFFEEDDHNVIGTREKTCEQSPTDIGEEIHGEANPDTCEETPKETAFSHFWEQMHPNCLVVLLKHQEGTNASATCTSACTTTMFLLWHISLRTLFQRIVIHLFCFDVFFFVL